MSVKFLNLVDALYDVPVPVQNKAYCRAFGPQPVLSGWKPFDIDVFRQEDVGIRPTGLDTYRYTIPGYVQPANFPFHRLSDYRR